MRNIGAWMMVVLVAFTAPRALAEGVDPAKEKAASTLTRLPNTTTVLVRPNGLLAMGNSSVSYLAKGARRWELLHRLPGDSLYRADLDDSGRVIATWEKDPSIHLFTVQPRQHLSIPKPPPPPDVSSWSVDRVLILPGGKDALVFMVGPTQQPSPLAVTAAFRIPLDGKGEPTLVFRVEDLISVHTSRHGVVFAQRYRTENMKCSGPECRPIVAILAYEFTENGMSRKTLLTREQAEVREIAAVRGSTHEWVVMKLELTRGGRALLRYRYGDAKADYRSLPPSDAKFSVVTDTGEFIELREPEEPGSLDIVRYPPEGGEQVTTLPSLHDVDDQPYAVGVRGNGGLWVHWGDHIALLTPGKPTLGYSIEPFISRRTEWAGVDLYVDTPEALWIGIDGRGRDFVRVGFDEMEKRAKPWR